MGATGNGLRKAPHAATTAALGRLGDDRPRLVVLEGLDLATPLDPYRALGELLPGPVRVRVFGLTEDGETGRPGPAEALP